MNISTGRTKPRVSKLQNLNENDQQQQTFDDSDLDTEKNVMQSNSLQFKFDSGVIMAKINVDVKNRFGLKWHAENTNNVEEFIESVNGFLAISEMNLTDNDKNRLSKEYQKFNK